MRSRTGAPRRAARGRVRGVGGRGGRGGGRDHADGGRCRGNTGRGRGRGRTNATPPPATMVPIEDAGNQKTVLVEVGEQEM
eukprot:7978356-Pyramimonas_sp.AAC.1